LKFSVACLAVLSFAACSNPDLSQDFDQRESLDAGFPTEKRAFQGEADASHQWEANEKLTKLLASFGSERAMENHERPKYPEYYGGGYITEQGGLVIYIYGNIEEGKKAVVSVIGDENTEFKEAKYSYPYLISLMDEFYAFVMKREDPDITEILSGFSLMGMTNDVEVQIIGLDERKLEILKKSVFNKPGVRFKAIPAKARLETTLYPGCRFARTASAQGGSSVGFRAKRNSDGAIGFVTTGHSISEGATAYYAGVPVGTCLYSQQYGTIDAAFVTLNNPASDNINNRLCGLSDILSTNNAYPEPGATVNKVGWKTGLTSGAIISTYAFLSVNGNFLTDLTIADYYSLKGDSGGAVYAISPSGSRFLAGIHMATAGSIRYYSKANNILWNFGISRY